MASNTPIKSLGLALQQTLSPNPAERRQAERALDDFKRQPGFSQLALQLAQSDTYDDGTPAPQPIRQAAALLFKNYIRYGWALDDENPPEFPVPEGDRSALKAGIVQVMIQLSNSPNIQVQVGEAIAVMAEWDFPLQWADLVNQLISNFSTDNFIVNNAVLQTAHAIFRRWRSQFRSDELFTEIKHVLDSFCEPYMSLFKRTDELLSSPTALPSPADPQTLARTLLLLLQIFYDLNSQDIPEFFEDNVEACMTLLHKYLTWSRPELVTQDNADDDEEGEAGPLEKIRASICEIAELYTQRYLEVFPMMEQFVETTWTLVTGLGSSTKYDILVSKAMSFLSVSVRMPGKKHMFEGPGILESFCERIILPNMVLRTFEEEMFEDDAFEYVRRDLLETAGADAETRRQSASDFTRALMEQFESRVTEIISRYIQGYLAEYATNPQANWKSKDTAVFLLTSIAARGSTAHHGVTSTNSLIDVVQFFSDHVVQDLQPGASGQANGASAAPHPIIVADAIKFLYTFRSQLTKEQLVSVIPLLSPHLQSESFVIHTYAAMTIERILFIKQNNLLIFTQADIRPYAEGLLVALFNTIERGTTPEEIAKNDNLMKCVMRVIITARQAMTPIYGIVLEHLTKIVAEISKNPSNPKFNHYTFESMSALVRFVTAGTPATLSEFENTLFPPFQYILAQDVAEFSPFVFQILSQLLELHSDGLPEAYQALLQPILMAPLWMQRGNIPALTRLLRAVLEKGPNSIVQGNHLPAIRDITRYLLDSKANDAYGAEIVEALFQYIPTEALAPYIKEIFVLLFTRLTSAKSERYMQAFVRAFLIPLAIRKPGLGPDELYQHVESLQPGIFVKMLERILPEVQKTAVKDRKTVLVGLAVLLTKSESMLQQPGVNAWPSTFEGFLRLLLLPRSLQSGAADEEEVTVLDLEESGYQASFSKLGASEPARRDPVADVTDPGAFMARSLAECSQRHPGQLPSLIQAVPQDLSSHFMTIVANEGLALQ
ncbi:putative importin-alpha export receptor [Cystobasidium minutum MCA 4210]|uniref:putative importin-alpha export receptor n=1 Tax=Cystobasidium minutum MCA 4210 TaxID=1397322 RepID=UPI0034CDECD6|eukprot:jgi/Rhomi1/194918/gm1.3132_g